MEFEAQTGSNVGRGSKINSGLLQVMRLDFLWKEASKFATLGLYKKWNDILDRVWCELAGDVKKEGEFKKFGELTIAYANTIKPMNKKVGFEDFSEEDLATMINQKQALINKEVFLRKLQNEQGKGTAYDDDEDEGFE